jgi:selenocysteine lyase/cysteine desulfurase
VSGTYDWSKVRAEFPLTPEWTHLTAMYLSSHPRRIDAAIARHRKGLDEHPLAYSSTNIAEAEGQVIDAAGIYFGCDKSLVARTMSTTMGLAQLYGGVRVRPGHEILTTIHEHFTTLDCLKLRQRRDGVAVRHVSLFRNSRQVSRDEVVRRLKSEIRPQTRVVALTWVYSSTGVKLPVADVAAVVGEENSLRGTSEDRLLLCVDGVHGYGVEADTFHELGCDFLVAGCHKWLFGPRGTGVIYGRRDAWAQVVPFAPSVPIQPHGPGQVHTITGTHPYEHWWALVEAYRLHLEIGRAPIRDRVHELAKRVKAGLESLGGDVVVVTPESADLSSGIVCFDVANTPAVDVVRHLRRLKIVVTDSAWDAVTGSKHLRVSVSILNNENDITRLIRGIKAMCPTLPRLRAQGVPAGCRSRPKGRRRTGTRGGAGRRSRG